MSDRPITFLRTRDYFGCFSNFSRHPVSIYGIYWPTTEHFYQAQKFYLMDEGDHMQAIRLASHPGAAAKLGRDPSHRMRPDWEEIKDDVMRLAIAHKFHQNDECGDRLLETGDKEIVEDSPKDWYWGWGKDKTGKNMLGKILMEVRDVLREHREWEKEIRALPTDMDSIIAAITGWGDSPIGAYTVRLESAHMELQ